MRMVYSSLEFAKSVARKLNAVTGFKLSACQEALARSSGYSGWHEFSQSRFSNDAASRELDFQAIASFIGRLASELGASGGDVLHSVSRTPLVSKATFSVDDLLSLRSLVFRKMEIPDPGRRKPGAVGKFQCNGRPLILRQFGPATRCISDRAHDVLVADFQYVTPRVPLGLFIPRRLYLPYGMWTERNGAIVLFSRDYLPLWRLRTGHAAERVSPMLWIDYVDQRWFWEDGGVLWENDSKWRIELNRLKNFGVHGLPKLVETLPKLVFQQPEGIRQAAKELFGEWIYDQAA